MKARKKELKKKAVKDRRLVLEFNPPWNLIANRGEIRPKQSPAEGGARGENYANLVMRDLLNKVGTYYQAHLCNETIPDFEEKSQCLTPD